MADQKVSLVPTGMIDAETNAFVLSRSEWINVQRYVAEAMQLPTTKEAMRTYLKGDASLPIDDFADLLDGYQQMNSHCTVWQNQTFPETVSLAGDIVAYANKASVYFKPLRDAVARLVEDPDSERNKQLVSGICDLFIREAETFVQRAESVKQKVAAFANDSSKDYDRLRDLQKTYDQRYGQGSKELKELQAKVDDLQRRLKELNDEYNHDVVVAATSPAYAWVVPFGTIAAAVVAGVYGDRAVKALKQIEEVKKELAQFEGNLAARFKLLNGMKNAISGMSGIADSLKSALPVIGKIQGLWVAIAKDLGKLKEIINGDIRDNLPILMDLGIDLAILTWQQIGQKADGYRVNAFVKFVEEEEAA